MQESDVAILVVSFGTSYYGNNGSNDTATDAIEAAIAKACPEYEVRKAFTNQTVINILKERDNLEIDNVSEALGRAAKDGKKEIIVQPTHLLCGLEYHRLAEKLTGYLDMFDKIVLASPLLADDVDFDAVVRAITERTASYDDGETAICFMGHGTAAEANAAYVQLQDRLIRNGYENYYIGTVGARPSLEDVVAALKAKGSYKKVVLEPLMVAAGGHANNDMAGTKKDSWKSVLEREGYEVECIIEGLGQIEGIQNVYVEHVQSASLRLHQGWHL